MESSETLRKFRRIDDLRMGDSSLDIPAPPQQRTITDKKGFVLYGVAILLYLSLIFAYYTTHESGEVELVQKSEIRFLFVGKNGEIWQSERHISDWEYFPKFIINIVITLGLCMLLLYSLVRAPSVVMWVIIYNSVIILGTLTYLAWMSFHPPGSPQWNIRQNPQLIIPIFLTLLTVFSVFFSCMFHKSLKHLSSLYQEVAKALFAMPAVLTSVMMVTIVQALILCVAVTMTAPLLKYQNNFPFALLIVSIIVVFWSMQMTAGFQWMMTAGSIASWYFASFRVLLQPSVLKSVANTAKFHLGTIALGTFCHPVVTTAKFLTIWSKVTPYLDGFSMKNGLVVTALHGQPFFKSARRARGLLEENFLVSLKLHSDFIVWLIRLHLLVYSSVISYGFFLNCDHPYVPMVICTVVSVILIFVLFETFEVTIYTLLICYCEDKCINKNTPSSYRSMTTMLDDIFDKSKQEHYNKNLLLANRITAPGNIYTVHV